MKTTIISAFPACGKSKYFDDWKKGYTYTKGLVLDSDSSEFSWVKDENGNNTKVRNPEFPMNYIQHIKDNIDKAEIIFVSSHKVVRDALKDNNIKYVLVYPENTEKAKEEYLRRYKNRGNDEGFIQFITNNWDNFIDEMEEETFPYKYILDDWQYISSIGTMCSIQNQGICEYSN